MRPATKWWRIHQCRADQLRATEITAPEHQFEHLGVLVHRRVQAARDPRIDRADRSARQAVGAELRRQAEWIAELLGDNQVPAAARDHLCHPRSDVQVRVAVIEACAR